MSSSRIFRLQKGAGISVLECPTSFFPLPGISQGKKKEKT